MTLTEEQLDIIGHSLGVPVYHAKKSKKKSERKLPRTFYRNYYNTPKCGLEVITELCKLGYMAQHAEDYYHVTPKGIEVFKADFNELLK